MGKLKFLKDRIRSWLSIHRSNSRGEIYFLKEELRSCDEVIDKGDCSNEVVHKHTEILNKIHQVNNIQASEIAQKAKIKWVIKGDENVKFFHGMLNKKRNQSNIRGIMVNGMWVDGPGFKVPSSILKSRESIRMSVFNGQDRRVTKLLGSKIDMLSSLDNSFQRKARSGIEEMQLNSLAEISRMTTLVPCEDRYV
ncbi:hypothetical protein Tco_0779063 [Tanacetum coccineum]